MREGERESQRERGGGGLNPPHSHCITHLILHYFYIRNSHSLPPSPKYIYTVVLHLKGDGSTFLQASYFVSCSLNVGATVVCCDQPTLSKIHFSLRFVLLFVTRLHFLSARHILSTQLVSSTIL